MAAAFFARPFPPAAAAPTPAWRAFTEVRLLGRFAAPAAGAARPVRLVPFGADEAEDFAPEARRTPAARRAPPFVDEVDREDRSDEPRDERRESLMAAPGPSGARTGPGAMRRGAAGRSATQYEHARPPDGTTWR